MNRQLIVSAVCGIIGALAGPIAPPSWWLVHAQTAAPSIQAPDSLPAGVFLGDQSCSASGCHAAADPHRNQHRVWLKQDPHARAHATLTTARAARLAEALAVTNPLTDPRCTSCHDPLQSVPAARRGPDLQLQRGVSCESCHGPASAWIRSHARPDFTYQERLDLGMRDLKSLHIRANSCVACHQALEPALEQSGHPQLLFELDGQSASMPRHWRESFQTTGANRWLTGQAAAVREMSWHLQRDSTPRIHSDLADRWQAAFWVLLTATEHLPGMRWAPPPSLDHSLDNWRESLAFTDTLAQRAAATPWSTQNVRTAVTHLASRSAHFRDNTIATKIHARRAERLVLALDRLTLALAPPDPTPAATRALDDLFASVQSIADFDSLQFAMRLEAFAETFR